MTIRDTQLIGCLNDDNVLAGNGKAIALLPRLGRSRWRRSLMRPSWRGENSIFPEWLLGHHLQLTLSAQEEQIAGGDLLPAAPRTTTWPSPR